MYKTKYRIKILLICLISITLLNNHLSAESEKKTSWQEISSEINQMAETEPVFMDNNFIQSYLGKEGIWQNLKKGEKINDIALKFHSEVDSMKKINQLNEKITKINKSGWYFLPFTIEYLSELSNAGIKRQVWEVPKAEFLWPVVGTRITSRIGKRMGREHQGIDIAAQIGTIVIAAMDGEIKKLGYQGAYGLSISINHDNDYSTKYAHLSVILVKEGEKVKKGQIIGYSGSTGYSTGPHLHFEVRCGGIFLDPEFFLSAFEESMESAMGHNKELKDQKSNN